MAYDKAVDSAQLAVDLTAVADAIRAKGGTDAQLAFPAGFVSAVQAIAAGGADLGAVEVYVADYHESAGLSITAGALDKYARVIVS